MELVLIWFTAAQMQPEHPPAVQPQQEVELVRHGVDLHFRFPVVVIVICQVLVAVRVNVEGPEPVQVHVFTDLQRQAGHDDARAEPRRPQALRAPEVGQALEVPRVEENRSDGTSEVLDGVEGPQRNGGVSAVGEGGKKEHGVPVAAQILYKRASTSVQSGVPTNRKQM